MKRVWIGAAAWLACCVAAAGASADTFCVAPEASCPAGNTYPNVQSALDHAAASSGNTVKLGAATYSDGPFTAGGANPVSIVGHGSGQTLLTISGAQSSQTVLAVASVSSTLSDVGIVVPQGSGNIGLSLSGTAERIAITTSTGSDQSTGVSASGFTAVLEDSTISGTTNGLALTSVMFGGSLIARHDTLIGDGSSGSVGAAAIATPSSTSGGGGVTLTVDDSIVRGFATDFSRQGQPGNGPCDPMINPICNYPVSATISFDYDDYGGRLDPTYDGTPGQYTSGSHNVVNIDPKFVAPAASPPDYHLPYNSPLIDAGMPSVESGTPAESTQDADNNPRKVGAATDIGAYEYQHRPPVISMGSPAPSQGGPGTAFNFTATASDPDPGDTVTVTWSFDDGGTANGASAIHAFSTPGGHTATAKATDSSGLTTSASTTVTVLASSSGAGGTGTGGTGGILTAPILSFLKLTPAAFRAATSGGSLTAASQKAGSTVSYADTQPGDTTFIVERAVPGVRRGRSCVQVSRPARRSKRCTRFVHVGGFAHRDAAGANRFHFTGRIGRAALSPGSYRLTAQARNSASLLGNVVTTQFRILAAPRRRRR